jgi:hypothetical protein
LKQGFARLAANGAAANVNYMWIRKRPESEDVATEAVQPGSLKQAVRQTRIELAERSAVIVELRDAELARLELLNEALDPLFKEMPPEVDLFDRGISRGDTPRLWVDAIAHVVMGRDKRRYRFVQDTRFGRKVLAESNDIGEIVKAVTHYVASRIVEREQALASTPALATHGNVGGRHSVGTFLLGLAAGCLAVLALIWIVGSQ